MTDDISLIIAVLSALFAGVGLILNYRSVRESNKTRQLQLLNTMFKDIQEKALILFREYKIANIETKKEWDSLFFNTLELFALLINEKFIKDKKLASFFDDAITEWYEKIFLKHYSNEIDNPKIFPEFKKLYHTIKLKQ